MVSIIEIIYFISLRPYCDNRRHRKKFDRNIKFVEPSKKIWFVEDMDHGKLDQLKQVKNAWDVNDSSKVVDVRNAYNCGVLRHDDGAYYTYRD